jgi:gliding motility-associated-like protein
MVSIDGGPDSLLQVLENTTTNYVHREIESYKNYCYYIRANHTSGLESTSNMICTYTQMPKIPEYINADFATIDNDNEVRLSFTIDSESEIYKFRLLKGSDSIHIEEELTTFFNPPSWKVEYTDIIDDASLRYYYKLVAMNACDSVVTESNGASNLVLKVENSEVINELTWRPYYSWLDGVDSYQVYRTIEDQSPELVVTLPGTDTAYSDDISAFQYSVPSGKFCYYILATEGAQNPHGITGSSVSNISCGVVPVHVFIPNAFTPNSDNKNDVFKPVLSFTPAQYILTIQNRWGNLIFESKDPHIGWEGDINRDKQAPEGVYIYYLRIITDEGEIIEKNGHVTLIYPK